jgi:hypothetical protein
MSSWLVPPIVVPSFSQSPSLSMRSSRADLTHERITVRSIPALSPLDPELHAFPGDQ